MNYKIWQRLFAVIMLLGLVLAPFQAGSVSAGPLAQGEQPPKAETPKTLAATGKPANQDLTPGAPQAEQKPADQTLIKPAIDTDAILAKLHPDLRELAKTASPALPSGYGELAASQEPVYIEVFASVAKTGDREPVLDISAYFVDGKVIARPALNKGDQILQVYYGQVYPYNLMKLAGLGEVQVILPVVFEQNAYPENYPIDDAKEIVQKTPDDWALLRANADKLRTGSLPWEEAKAYGDGRIAPVTEDWFEVQVDGPHKAMGAWDRGFTGEGVTVAVNDDGIDFAHPDLMGTQKIYSSTVNTQYNGWPVTFSPFSMLLYVNDSFLGTTYIQDGYFSAHYVDTSATPATYSCATGIKCFDFTPLIDVGTPGLLHTYQFPSTWSQSGVVHVGTHPDFDLRDYVWGERPAVLVTDPNVAGVYDTVVVDLDDDYNFGNDKPLTKADTSSAAALEATKNNMVSYRDMNGDGAADISGGALYFIADGASCIPASDYVWGCPGPYAPIPGNGDLVAFSGSTFDRAYSHGTQCASNVVGQGVVQNASLGLDNSFLPSFRDLPPGPGKPAAAVYGMAPGAKVVNVADIYYNHESSTVDAYLFATVGWDGIDQTGWDLVNGVPASDTDIIVANSNSYGDSAGDNDGWDFRGQVVAFLQRWYGPYEQYLFSTGNGAPGYGTSAPPSPATGIAVGASTEYGSTGWDTITDTNQISFNDVVAFSNSGPGARGGAGVDVLAGGAFAAGDEELNYYSASTWGALDGNMSWVSWGGTSRSAPTALGVLALIYQAYKDAHGDWPTHETAKAILMSSATNLNANVFRQGAGSVNADRGTAIASGEYGVYLAGGSSDWTPGDFRGDDYPAFAHVVYPGGAYTKTFTVVNDSADPVDVAISDAEMQLIDSVEFDFTVTPAMIAAESAYGGSNRDNFYKSFQYMIPITSTASAGMQNIVVPADTELMVVRQMFPYAQFDTDGNYGWDNRYYLMVYNWKDVNGDGDVWEDKDGNGVVNIINDTNVTLIDYGTELVWDDPRTELDRWEYSRFGYNRPSANTNELMVHDPLSRMHDGLFIGLRHLFTGNGAAAGTTLSYRIEFYKNMDAAWIDTSVASLTVPAGGSATFDAYVNIPADLPAGDYEAAIEVVDPTETITDPVNTAVIPVVINVAQEFNGANSFGGFDTYLDNYGLPYNNAAVRGYQEWGWRAESGDWRMFYMDIDNVPVETLLFSEGFEGAWPPAGWTVITNTNAGWNTNTFWGRANITPGADGIAAGADADSYGAGLDTELWSPAIDLTGTNSPYVVFDSNFQDFAGGGDAWMDVSTDGGTSWTNEFFRTTDDPASGATYTVDLSAYAGSTVWLRFHFVTPGWDWYWYIDDVAVYDAVFPYAPDAHVIVRDQWEGPGPHNDIDTVVLGPSPSELPGCWYCGTDPAFFGPYTLTPVGSSPNTNVSAGIWLFDTSSGANEDWVAFPIQDGLHRILEHNVLFEGDQFDVVFTKTVGLLTEDVHSFDLTTYLSDGVLGEVTLESSIDLPGLVGDGFVAVAQTTELVDEPLPFTGSGTIEWVYPFSVADGVSIEVYTGSAISDIDLYLFFWNGSSYEQRASSAGGSSAEYIFVENPEDGDWLVAIDNYSGPAGFFDMVLNVVVRAPGSEITFTGSTTSNIPANTPTTITVNYSGMSEPGVYSGVITLGPTSAPALKQIPFTLTRLAESGFVQKSADVATAFPGDAVNYTIDLFNLTDENASFEFWDPFPDGVEYVSHVNPLVDVTVWEEGFEGAFPPAGWTTSLVTGTNWVQTSLQAHSGSYSAYHNDDIGFSDAWLITPQITPAATTRLDFWQYENFASWYIYHGIWVSTGSPDPADGDFVEVVETGPGAEDAWELYSFDLSAYAGTPIYVGFKYEGDFADEWYIDDVRLVDQDTLVFTYDAGTNSLLYTGPLPLGDVSYPAADEGFEGAGTPEGWEIEHLGTGAETWTILNNPAYAHSGSQLMSLWWDVPAWDEWLYTPMYTINSTGPYTMTFWATSVSTPEPCDTWDFYYTVQLNVLDEDGNVLDTPWDMDRDTDWTWDCVNLPPYNEVSVDLSAYAGQNIQLAWHAIGEAYFVYFMDDVSVPGVAAPIFHPSVSVETTVMVSDTVNAGDYITNTAYLQATHFMPQGEEVEPTVMDDAVFHIGMEDFATSQKTATATVTPWGMIEYQIHVENSGDALAHVVVTDTVPAGTVFYGLDNSPPSQHFTFDGVDTVSWEGNVPPGNHFVFTFWVTVDGWDYAPGDVIENTAYLSWNGVTMPLTASTEIVFEEGFYLPFVSR